MILPRTQAWSVKSAAKRAAFTLMEVLVVAAILVILASVASVGVLRYLDDAKEKTAYTGVMKLEQAAAAFKINHGDWPTSLAELTIPEEGKAAPIDQNELRDPWGIEYVYDLSNRHPTKLTPLIYSTGGGAKQIRNW
jgi:general secretion pathway protein G